ncbi:hypothetical protein FFLO_00219 [Filobasidium floriforme]|uniref:C2H2-type domain-containing protein n=1 Tax=Filobasidium floriforme TaxID=5210 RepID=A0A8K0JTJ7_9TREE|nr:domain of Kin17 curved DNA-binding protein-domain-containing protein [Filobasidium floriforme]KAG7580011.1 hypothetical protein FFLO_00219 [Filobasidium floriforme]KAH8087411.1 domain of Kin17 curved DNA-binding protein-domain-containing protein [Filobasidium floriforme]
MPRAEAGSAKAIGNAIKAKGLGRLVWYCQVCQKQCRDENGFKMHSQSESHLRQMLVVGENAGKHIDTFSKDFQDEFLTLLSRRHNTQRVRANAVYNEYIQDKHHIHMNSTKWVTLTEFIKYMGREGLVRVDENEKGFWIQWVDNSPKALARQAEMQKRERADMDDEQRQRRQLREQMERARLQAEARGQGEVAKGLQRAEGEKVSLSLNLGGLKPKEETVKTEPEDTVKTESEETFKSESEGTVKTEPAEAVKNEPASPSTPVATPTVTMTNTAKVKTEPAPNPLKRAAPTNIFKTSSKSSKSTKESTPSSTPKSHLAGKKFLTAAERLMLEDQARAGRKISGGSGGYQGMGPSRR